MHLKKLHYLKNIDYANSSKIFFEKSSNLSPIFVSVSLANMNPIFKKLNFKDQKVLHIVKTHPKVFHKTPMRCYRSQRLKIR